MAYGFVKQSGGHIKIYSEPGQGTTVKIYLPRSMERAADLEPVRHVPPTGGSETILVVEDDRRVQTTVVETLRQLGYTVLKADDAQSALAIVQSGVHIDLMFTDVVMPGPMRSTELAKLAARTLPDLKVLFTSGYTQNAIVHGGRLDPGVHLLSKPHSREQLASKIRRLLGPARSRSAGDASVSLSSSADVAISESAPGPAALSVLVVDDEDASRDALCELLACFGYDVKQAVDADEALRVLTAQNVDVLVTDIMLPGRSGVELAKAAVELRAGIRIVFASGGAAPSADALGFDFVSLRKPFTAEQLHALIAGMQAPGGGLKGNE